MSDLRDAINDVVIDRAPLFGDSVINLTTGEEFNAEFESIQDLGLDTQIGSDDREAAMMHVEDATAAAALTLNCKVRMHDGSMWEVTHRSDNPANVQVDFTVRKMVSGVDT